MLAALLPYIFAASSAVALASLTYSAHELASAWPAIRRALLALEL